MAHLAILPTDRANWRQSYRCANHLLDSGVSVSWATEPFIARSASGGESRYERGTILVHDWPANARRDAVRERFAVEPADVDQVDGFVGLQLKRLRIGHYGGGGAPYNHARIFAELGFLVDFVNPQDIIAGRLDEFDMLIVPGGGAIGMVGQMRPLGEKGCEKVGEFVRRGGMYVGACAGSFIGAVTPDIFTKEHPEQKHMQLANAAIWNEGGAWLGLESPGVGVIESHNAAPDHPLMFGMPDRFPIAHYNGPIFEPCNGGAAGASDMIGLASVAGLTDDFTPSEYFMRWSEFDAEDARTNGIMARAAREGRFNVVAGYNGNGRVALFGSHAEFGFNLAMDEWDEPARMLANAAFWQAGHITESRPIAREVAGIALAHPLGAGLKTVAKRLPVIDAAAGALRKKDVRQAPWLGDDLAMSTFGLSGREIWTRNLETFAEVTRQIEETLAAAGRSVERAMAMRGKLRHVGKDAMARDIDYALRALEQAIHYRAPAEWHHDYGYEGVLQMLDRAEAMLGKAEHNFAETFDPSPNPYAHIETSPYQLVAAWYLAAVGVYANCWFLLRVHLLRLDGLLHRAELALRT